MSPYQLNQVFSGAGGGGPVPVNSAPGPDERRHTAGAKQLNLQVATARVGDGDRDGHVLQRPHSRLSEVISRDWGGEREGEKHSQPLSASQTFWLPHSTGENVNIVEKLETKCEICERFTKFTRAHKSASH